MRTKRSSKAALFLIEMIIAIVFFSLASAVCVQLFAQAHTLTTRSRDLSMAVNVAQSAAERFKTAASPRELYGAGTEGVWNEYYDGSWARRDSVQGGFRLQVTYNLDAQPARAEIVVLRDDDDDNAALYSIVVKRVLPGNGEEAE